MNYIIIETTVSSAVKTKHGYKLKTKEGVKCYLEFSHLGGKKIKPGDKLAIYFNCIEAIEGITLNGEWLLTKTEKRKSFSESWMLYSLLALETPMTDDPNCNYPFTLPMG